MFKLSRFFPLILASFFIGVLLVANTPAKGFQAMRLSAGTFRIGGGASGRIPATCIQSSKATPRSSDIFEVISGNGLSVTREETVNGIVHRQTLPGNEAMTQWLKIRGNNSTTSVIFEPRVPRPNVTYTVRVTTSGTFLSGRPSSANEISELRNRVDSGTGQLEMLDRYGAELQRDFGANSGIYKDYLSAKQLLEWDTVDGLSGFPAPATRREIANLFGEGLRSSLSAQSRSERLTHITVLHGSRLTEAQIRKIESLTGLPIGRTHPPGTLATVNEYLSIRQALDDGIGSEHPIVERFAAQVRTERLLGSSLREGLDAGKSSLIGDDLREALERLPAGAGCGDFFALVHPTFYGERLTDVQVRLVERLSGLDLGPASERFNDRIILAKRSDEGDPRKVFTVTDKNGSADMEFGNLPPAEIASRLRGKKVVLDDLGAELDGESAAILKNAGVRLVQNLEDFVMRPVQTAKTVKLIFVTSKDAAVANGLFEGQDFASIAAANKVIDDIPAESRLIVETRQELEAALKGLSATEQAVVIFHNAEKGYFRGINFEQRIYLDELTDMSAAISCNTYKDGSLAFRTTDRLDFPLTAKALADSVAKHGNRPVPVDEFMFSFHENYEQQVKVSKIKRSVILVGKFAGSAGVLYILHAISNLIGEKEQRNDRDERRAARIRPEKQQLLKQRGGK